MNITSAIHNDIELLLTERVGPCLSLYMPTHRHHPENKQDPIVYKNLVKSLEESLLRQHSSNAAKTLLEAFRRLPDDATFWNSTWDGLAVLGAAGMFRVIKLQRTVSKLAIVAPSFHVKPLLRSLQSADRYQVLALNRRDIRLYEGDREALDEVKLEAGVPRTIDQALGAESTEPHETVGSYGGVQAGSSMRHGHGSRTDEADSDEDRFFRAIDRAILDYHSRPSGLPLLLAALKQYHATFRKLSRNPLLLDHGIEVDASSLTIDQLRQRAWAEMEPLLHLRMYNLGEEFKEAQSKALGTDDLAIAAQAAAESRVKSLLLEADRRIPGRMDKTNGGITLGELEHPEVDDLLDDLAELVLQKGGTVAVIRAEEMPTKTGLAATYRF